jgi:hypothetical protein
MDPTIHVQEMHVDHRKELSHPRAKQHGISDHPSLSVSYIKKSLLPGHHQSFPIQVSFLNFVPVIIYRRLFRSNFSTI